jgi:hypothetical protein
VLAVVQDQQQLLIAHGVRERLLEAPFGGLLDAQDGRNAVRDEGRIRDLGQLHQPHAVEVGVGHSLGKLDRKSGLARAADAGEGEQAGGGEKPLDLGDLPLSADHGPGHGRRATGSARRFAQPLSADSHRHIVVDRGANV